MLAAIADLPRLSWPDTARLTLVNGCALALIFGGPLLLF